MHRLEIEVELDGGFPHTVRAADSHDGLKVDGEAIGVRTAMSDRQSYQFQQVTEIWEEHVFSLTVRAQSSYPFLWTMGSKVVGVAWSRSGEPSELHMVHRRSPFIGDAGLVFRLRLVIEIWHQQLMSPREFRHGTSSS
ncbi:unnamed protein product [Victoria cruziana]